MPAAVFAGGDAALSLEELGEVALVEEASLGGDIRDEFFGRFQELAGGVQADGREVASGRDAECARELPPEVRDRCAEHCGEVFKGDVLGVMRVYVFSHGLQQPMPVRRAADGGALVVDAGCAYERTVSVEERKDAFEMVVIRPVDRVLMEPVDNGAASAAHFLVVFEVGLCQRRRKDVVAVPADGVKLVVDVAVVAVALVERHYAPIRVLHVECDVRQKVHHRLERGCVRPGLFEEFRLQFLLLSSCHANSIS